MTGPIIFAVIAGAVTILGAVYLFLNGERSPFALWLEHNRVTRESERQHEYNLERLRRGLFDEPTQQKKAVK